MTGAPPPARPDVGSRLVGWLLIALGGLMVLLCGGCTLIMWGVGVFAMIDQPGAEAASAAAGMFTMSAVIGGVPTAAGAVLVWAGYRILRPKGSSAKATAKTFE
jgi:hypothetical protein